MVHPETVHHFFFSAGMKDTPAVCRRAEPKIRKTSDKQAASLAEWHDNTQLNSMV